MSNTTAATVHHNRPARYDGSPEADARWDAQEAEDRKGAWIICPDGCGEAIPERDQDDHWEASHVTMHCGHESHHAGCLGYIAPLVYSNTRPCLCSCHPDVNPPDFAASVRRALGK